jgi:hypothetical protein
MQDLSRRVYPVNFRCARDARARQEIREHARGRERYSGYGYRRPFAELRASRGCSRRKRNGPNTSGSPSPLSPPLPPASRERYPRYARNIVPFGLSVSAAQVSYFIVRINDSDVLSANPSLPVRACTGAPGLALRSVHPGIV